MDLILLGFVATLLTTISVLPQVIKVIKLKETRDLSFLYWGVLASGLLLWFVYGVLKQDAPIIISNFISLVFSVIMIGLKLKYGD
jgi:MtN3 and saliva related transmembrane protein